MVAAGLVTGAPSSLPFFGVTWQATLSPVSRVSGVSLAPLSPGMRISVAPSTSNQA